MARTLEEILKADTIDSNGNHRAPVDEAALENSLFQVEARLAAVGDELKMIVSGMRRSLGASDEGALRKEHSRLGVLAFDIRKSLNAARATRNALSIAKSLGANLSALRGEERDLRKCIASPDAQKLDGPTQRRLRLALHRVEIEIAQAEAAR